MSPEFLAALPSNIQLEVLAEQNRLSTQNPDAPVDAGSFIRSLPPTLRQQVGFLVGVDLKPFGGMHHTVLQLELMTGTHNAGVVRHG